MTFSLKKIIGHDDIIKSLTGALVSGRVAHSYLFSGPEGVGKFTVALSFAQALMCNRMIDGYGCGECSGCRKVVEGVHPEVVIFRPQGSTLKIEQIRQLTAGVKMGAAMGTWTVRIVDKADTMTVEAANSLLKTLEDPLSGVIIILITTRPQVIVPTILSRCQHLYFQPLLIGQIVEGITELTGVTGKDALLAATLAGGSLARALDLLSGGFSMRDRACELIKIFNAAGIEEVFSLAKDTAASKEKVLPLLELMALWLRDVLVYNETDNSGQLINVDRLNEIKALAGCYTTGRAMEMIRDLELTMRSLEVSANVQLALEVLFMRLAGKGLDTARLEEVV